MAKIIKSVWLLVCIAVAIWGTLAGGDADIVAVYILGALTFPIGLIVYVIGSGVLGLFAKADPNFGVSYDFAISVVMYSLTILAGYWQWFNLLPKCLAQFRKWRASKS